MPGAAGELGNRFQCRANIQSSKLERDGLGVTGINYCARSVLLSTIATLLLNDGKNESVSEKYSKLKNLQRMPELPNDRKKRHLFQF